MRIAVLSPVRRAGITTVSMLIATAFADMLNMSVLWTHTSQSNNSINAYLGLSEDEDRTTSIKQIVRLLRADAISGADISDYCKRLSNNLEILNTCDHRISPEESSAILSYIVTNVSHDVIITDIATELYDNATQSIIEKADIIVMVFNQSKDIYNTLSNWRVSEYYKPMKNKGIIYVINKFDENVSSLKQICKELDVDYKRCGKISYNSNIMKESNNGILHKMMPFVKERDHRVYELFYNMKDILQMICANQGINCKIEEVTE